jgi:pilus biogenesis lipoprotein CpaD
MAHARIKFCLVTTAVMLSGCSANLDMHGNDPVEYYAEHPIENKVETRYTTYTAHFVTRSERLSDEDIDGMQAALRDVSPEAVETVKIQMAPGGSSKLGREEYLIKLLRSMGYTRKQIRFVPSDALDYNDAKLDVTYAAVVPPHCPDWRTSPVTSYSNTTQGNFGCSQAVNIGQMVADPHDLRRGAGDVPYDAARSGKVIDDYKNSKDLMPATIAAGGGSSSSGSTSSGSTSSSGSTGSTGSGQ